MPLQNRVTPHGALVAVEGRGLLMGNRGILHDGARRIVRHAQGRRWIACLTSFRGRRRVVMRPGSYTELFFLDEAVALSAGHRPCAADVMDRRLHADRLVSPRARRTYVAPADELPDGTYVDVDGRAWLLWGDSMLAWSPAGYAERRARAGAGLTVLTPRCGVDVLAAGYRPLVHPSASGRP